MIDIGNYEFIWKEEKDLYLQQKRQISFDDLVASMRIGGIIEINQNKKEGYTHQHTIIIIFKHYYWDIQCFIDRDRNQIHLITAYPNRLHKRSFTSLF